MATSSKIIKVGMLLIVLISIPLTTVLNQRIQSSQTSASERRDRDDREERERMEERKREARKRFILQGYVFEDINHNKIKDKGENGVVGINVDIGIIARKNYRYRIKNPVQKTAITDSFGYFSFDISHRLNPNSILYSISIVPPAGYIFTTNSYQVRREVRKSSRQIIMIGLTKSTTTPMPTVVLSPTPKLTTIIPSALPTVLSTTFPTEIPTQIPTEPVPTSISATLIPPTVTPPQCPSPPECVGELLTIGQEGMLVCPLYICSQYAP